MVDGEARWRRLFGNHGGGRRPGPGGGQRGRCLCAADRGLRRGVVHKLLRDDVRRAQPLARAQGSQSWPCPSPFHSLTCSYSRIELHRVPGTTPRAQSFVPVGGHLVFRSHASVRTRPRFSNNPVVVGFDPKPSPL
uniref:(northern house mosquito) hypothetical protein n=1 Tax=Culex pipiens TaxID=7175 RepID=A0A8D8B9I0_CULPI